MVQYPALNQVQAEFSQNGAVCGSFKALDFPDIDLHEMIRFRTFKLAGTRGKFATLSHASGPAGHEVAALIDANA
jgi:hypothetical protein